MNEGGVVEASDPPAGTDQPVDDIAHIINHFRFNRTVSQGELRQNHIYLVSKYGSYLHTHDSLDEDADVPNGTHEVYATAVANVDEYHKVIDEEAVDFATSRREELNGLLKSTLEAVRLETSDANICGTKWVDKVKPDGSLKSRLVVQGFTQVWLKDYHDTFSAVATLTTFRIMINLAAILGWEIYTIDVSQAYTQGELMETIYIRAPKTHPLPHGMVYKLRRPLYGTKQAGRCWYLHVTRTLRDLDLQQATKYSCFFIHRDNATGKRNLMISVLQ